MKVVPLPFDDSAVRELRGEKAALFREVRRIVVATDLAFASRLSREAGVEVPPEALHAYSDGRLYLSPRLTRAALALARADIRYLAEQLARARALGLDLQAPLLDLMPVIRQQEEPHGTARHDVR